ncbi:hypothetical protein BST36_08245 [Mycolicibacterium moriokaense]|jgi:fumarate reductase flavoprotein subunit|uniref:FAD-dependent oxidoreductase 2 FAD-binding domain-containing protein n=1 Tax=Mycolicibacterium moriokaense TaxID=39691 RepID=A0AAD1HHF2_9MYCO|nr:FAD-dependent oxidoreductase [Mycolicibacterium moriokaense]MCV7041967.1 FAD-dependent oxidoreductase [Mycolicibacterium moriokaense]ORB25057.1 hypothetical protein BST36_08245 [Mycolicibacterium moriokaense]BBX04734.1 hypothetical protein MMOR_56700 [Mycolicibacterium moriokaense]
MGHAQPDYDVAVVGSGAAGLCAALEAAARGATVLLIESQPELGGSTMLSGGIVMAADTSVQRAAGISDSAEALWHDYTYFNQSAVEPGIARHLAYNSGPAVEWLIEHGVRFVRELVYAADEPVPRSHVPTRGGAGIVKALVSAIKERPGVDIAVGQRISRLVTDGHRVIGVAAGDDVINAGAVVIATGGFGANKSLWSAHMPSLTQAGAMGWYVGGAGAQGDAFRFAAQVGAEIVGNDRGLIVPTPGFFTNLEVYFPGWLMMVDRTGQRRVDESASYSIMELAFKRFGPLYAIFDETAKRAAATGVPPEYKQAVPGMEAATSSNWVEPVIDEMVGRGKVSRAETLGRLADSLSVHVAGLENAVARYNDFARCGEDVDFRKGARFLRPIAAPPFYGCELRLGILALTAVGPRIDADARVVGQGGVRIPGLFAAGECAGGVLGGVYMGSGNSMANCVVFGRTAGAGAAQEAIAGRRGTS